MTGRTSIRVATASDLAVCHELWVAASGLDSSPPPLNPLLAHVLRRGRLVVAEQRGVAVGFAGSFISAAADGAPRWLLTDLCVDPTCQAAGVGSALLAASALDAPPRRQLLASADPAAHALYVRLGLAGRWPCYYLHFGRAGVRRLAPPWLRAECVEPGDGRVREIVGAHRGDDIEFWTGPAGARALLLSDESGFAQAVAFVHPGSPWALRDRGSATVGAVIARRSHAAADAFVAVVGWALSQGAPAVRLFVPGSHPALRVLVAAGARIVGQDTYFAADARDADEFDPTRYAPSITLG